VLSVEMVNGFLTEPAAEAQAEGISLEGRRTELRGLQWISDRINQSTDLEALLDRIRNLRIQHHSLGGRY
jgi:hypothetical protein